MIVNNWKMISLLTTPFRNGFIQYPFNSNFNWNLIGVVWPVDALPTGNGK